MSIEVVRVETPHKSSRKGHRPSMVVIHGDAGRTDAGTVSWIRDPRSKVSYTYLVGRDGTVYQFVDESEKAWHAGKSEFHGEEVANSVNPISIGLAFANNGSEPYRPVQYEVGARLLSEICARHEIPLHRVRGHFEVSPGRKTDPWDHFDWNHFYCRFGHWARKTA